MRWIKIYAPLAISCLALFLSLFSFYYPHAHKVEQEKRFAKKILANVRSCVEYNKDITQKQEIYEVLDSVEENSQIVETGSDELRIKFVNSQGCIEHVLACFQALGEIDQLIGVIHTPTPATPLCIKPDGNINDILDSSIRYNLDKLLTVRSRAQIMREYLIKGGKLYVVYPQGGLEKRTPAQQAVYLEEIQHFKGSLFDWVLSTSKMSDDMIGATYLFRNTEDQVFAFSIKARQANDIQPEAEWGIWFGTVLNSKVKQRVNDVFDYLAKNGGPDIRKSPSFSDSSI